MKILINFLISFISRNFIIWNYPLEAYTNAGSLPVSIKGRVTKLKISHILIVVRGVALIATELSKLICNMTISNGNRNIVTNVDLLSLAYYTNALFGSSLNSTTDARILVPVGTIDTDTFDLNYQILSSSDLAANAMTIDITGHLLNESLPITCLEKRAMPVAPVYLRNVLKIYDVSTAYNSTTESVITFPGNSQMTVKHKTAFALHQVLSTIEADQVFGLVYNDKDMAVGRDITVLPSAAYNALIVSLFKG